MNKKKLLLLKQVSSYSVLREWCLTIYDFYMLTYPDTTTRFIVNLYKQSVKKIDKRRDLKQMKALYAETNRVNMKEVQNSILFKHTFSQGWLEGVQGGNMFHGFMVGAVSGVGNYYIHNNLQPLGKAGKITASAILGGTVSEMGGGKFANGAITGAFNIMFNDMMHDMRQKIQAKKKYREFPNFKKLWSNYPHDINGKHVHPSIDSYENQCAIRLAYALKKSGVDFSNYDMGPVTSEGFPRGAKSLADWLRREFGHPTSFFDDTYEFKNHNSKTGIFFLKGPNGFADHIDIWNGKKSGSGIYESIKVWFWEIK